MRTIKQAEYRVVIWTLVSLSGLAFCAWASSRCMGPSYADPEEISKKGYRAEENDRVCYQEGQMKNLPALITVMNEDSDWLVVAEANLETCPGLCRRLFTKGLPSIEVPPAIAHSFLAWCQGVPGWDESIEVRTDRTLKLPQEVVEQFAYLKLHTRPEQYTMTDLEFEMHELLGVPRASTREALLSLESRDLAYRHDNGYRTVWGHGVA